jgi:hypothetical protein
VQFEGGDSYQGMPSGVPLKLSRMPASAAVTAEAVYPLIHSGGIAEATP